MRPTYVSPLVLVLVPYRCSISGGARNKAKTIAFSRVTAPERGARLPLPAVVVVFCMRPIGGKATSFWRLESSSVPLADCWEKTSLPVFSDLRPNLPEKIHLLPYSLFLSANNTTIITTPPITTRRARGRARWVLQHTKNRPFL